MLVPEGIVIDGLSGAMAPHTGHYVKRLSDLEHVFRDEETVNATITRGGDAAVYEVVEYRKAESDLFFGTTIIHPGDVSGEFYMTRGHFHQRIDCGEVYYTQSGRGLLLLEDRAGETRTVEMLPGTCAFIPPNWAHRSINTGGDKLVFVWVCNPLAGHDYGTIAEHGMRKLVLREGDGYTLADNPAFQGHS
ncbi:MAG: glucose-6-phosphate isomerase family protein [Pseudorhodobacter sp.]